MAQHRCSCGVVLLPEALFCHKCGRSVAVTHENNSAPADCNTESAEILTPPRDVVAGRTAEERWMVEALRCRPALPCDSDSSSEGNDDHDYHDHNHDDEHSKPQPQVKESPAATHACDDDNSSSSSSSSDDDNAKNVQSTIKAHLRREKARRQVVTEDFVVNRCIAIGHAGKREAQQETDRIIAEYQAAHGDRAERFFRLHQVTPNPVQRKTSDFHTSIDSMTL